MYIKMINYIEKVLLVKIKRTLIKCQRRLYVYVYVKSFTLLLFLEL